MFLKFIRPLHPVARHAIVALAVVLVVSDVPAIAQQVLRIAAVVNDRVISQLDVVNRLEFAIYSSGLPDTPENRQRLAPQVLRNLIDEQLMLQEAERSNVEVTQAEIDSDFARLAQRNDMSPQRLADLLTANGIDRSTLDMQVRARIAWAKVVSRRARREVQVTEEEVEAELQEMAARQNRPQIRLAEIVLSVDDPDQDEQVRRSALRLIEQIRQDASFSALAQSFSQSSTASTGGDLGWLTEEQLDPDLAAAVKDLEPGQIAGPIRLFGGYYIMLMISRREAGGIDPDETVLSLAQIVLPLPEDAPEAVTAAQRERAEALRRAISSCAGIPRAISDVEGAVGGTLGELTLGDLSDELRSALRDLQPGQTTEPLLGPDGNIVLLTVCEREEPKGGLPSAREVRQQLQGERMELLARRYLRDLRRTAVVDVRQAL